LKPLKCYIICRKITLFLVMPSSKEVKFWDIKSFPILKSLLPFFQTHLSHFEVWTPSRFQEHFVKLLFPPSQSCFCSFAVGTLCFLIPLIKVVLCKQEGYRHQWWIVLRDSYWLFFYLEGNYMDKIRHSPSSNMNVAVILIFLIHMVIVGSSHSHKLKSPYLRSFWDNWVELSQGKMKT